MKKHIKQKAVLVLLLLNLLIMTNGMAYAAENQIELELSVKQNLEYKNAVAEQLNQTGTYELTGVTEDTPMPENSENKSYVFSMKGVDETIKIPIVYKHGGIYQYQLTQITEEQERYTYDKTKYAITVYIKNTNNGGLTPEVIVENGSGKKCESIHFTNQYQGESVSQEKETEHVKTGDETKIFMWCILAGSSLWLIVIVGHYVKNVVEK